MRNEKQFRDGDLSTHEAFIASQRSPLLWKIVEALAGRLRPQPDLQAQDPEQGSAAGLHSIYQSVRLR